jgi:hypothetical protein
MSTSHTLAGWDGWVPGSSVGSAVSVGRSFGSAVSVGFSGFGVLVGSFGFGVKVGLLSSLSPGGVFVGPVVLLGRGVSLGGTGVLVGGTWVAVGVRVGLSLGSFVFVFSGTGVWVGGLPGVLVACGAGVSVGRPRGGVTVAPLPGLVVDVGVEARGLASDRAVAVALGTGTGV